MTIKTFKDKCDNCGKMDICKGYNGKVLCPACIKEEEKQTNGEQHTTTSGTDGVSA